MTIKRLHVGARMSQAVISGETVYLAGIVANDDQLGSIADQTASILAKIDGYLAEAGSDKSKLLSATIWLTDVGNFNEMNAVWDAWVAPGNTPARACVEAKLAVPKYHVEIAVIAAL